MNSDVFASNWKQVRGQAKVWWGKLTDDDLDAVAGRFEMFIGLLQEKYGYSRVQAEREIEQHMKAFDSDMNRKTQPHKQS
ncbi:MAG TPA: CsbD family protein [Anaerolineales bacterium]|nr:CsbD family protein [Anaerolineales bacterium]